ncbi:tRNA (N6-threonylcarbamoyladenosine(37)-N6)-methyltransferase TrmO [Kaarinaea lacus]
MGNQTYQFNAIGVVRSCYREKFGIPRQPGIVMDAVATLELAPPYNRPEAIAELEGFSHVWVIFVFHDALREEWRPTVRPPRLGGNQRIGVFASRSPFRPNPIGLSVVKLDRIECSGDRCLLHLRGADLMDGTPVLDIKPYLPYADAITGAEGGYAAEAPGHRLSVTFSELAEVQCAERERSGLPGLRGLIEQIIAQDPRPAYVQGNKPDEGQRFGMRLYDFDLRLLITGEQAEVLELCPVPDEDNLV